MAVSGSDAPHATAVVATSCPAVGGRPGGGFCRRIRRVPRVADLEGPVVARPDVFDAASDTDVAHAGARWSHRHVPHVGAGQVWAGGLDGLRPWTA